MKLLKNAFPIIRLVLVFILFSSQQRQESAPANPTTGLTTSINSTTASKRVLIKLPFHKYYREINYQVIDGRAVYQGDIDLGAVNRVRNRSVRNFNAVVNGQVRNGLVKLKRNTHFEQIERLQFENFQPPLQTRSSVILDPQHLWNGGIVPYEIAPTVLPGGFSRQSFIDTIRMAMDIIESNTVVRFVPRTNQKDFVRFINLYNPNTAGLSQVGKRGGKQTIRLNEDKIPIGSIMHEIMHTLGIYHTQSRSDRDEYVCVYRNNAVEDYRGNFDIHNGETYTGVYGPYNIFSFMHYSSCAFADEDCDTSNFMDQGTIIALDSEGECNTFISKIRTPAQWPQSDINTINYMYSPINSDPDVIINAEQSKTVTVTIENLQTLKGPEENGWGCNDRMDYYGHIQIGTLRDITADPYSFSSSDNFVYSKIEGNNINPDWQANTVLRAGERFAYIKIFIYDDDKKGPGGIGACGDDDDMVDVSPFSNRNSMHLVLDTSTNEIHQSNTIIDYERGHFGQPISINSYNSTLNGVVARIGESFVVSGNLSKTFHVASMEITVDME